MIKTFLRIPFYAFTMLVAFMGCFLTSSLTSYLPALVGVPLNFILWVAIGVGWQELSVKFVDKYLT